VIVTFDNDLRDKVLRGRCRCLHLRPPERTARQRVAAAYDEISSLFVDQEAALVVLSREGDAGKLSG
jgi:hypothetical protein